MNKISKYIAIASLSVAVTVSAPQTTNSTAFAKSSAEVQQTQQASIPASQKVNLGIKIQLKQKHYIYKVITVRKFN